MKSNVPISKEITSKELSYDDVTEGARFREQYRFVFAATIVATFYAFPSNNVLEGYVKWVLGFAMFFAALYLICTAASVKYNDRQSMYIVFYVSNRVRMNTFDWAVDCFAIGLLGFLSLAAVGFVQTTFNVHFSNNIVILLVVACMLIIGGIIGLVGFWHRRIDDKNGEDTNLLI